MGTPEGEVCELEGLVLKWSQGLFPVDVVAFRVGECIIRYKDPALLDSIPKQVVAVIEEMIYVYKRDGAVISYSSLGAVDRSDFVAQLIGVLDR